MPVRITQAEAASLGIEPATRYHGIIHQIVSAKGAFVGIDPDALAGTEIISKQSTLLRAARVRGLKIVTTTRKPGVIFAKLVVDPCPQPRF
jgi:hypothetical protein